MIYRYVVYLSLHFDRLVVVVWYAFAMQSSQVNLLVFSTVASGV